MLILRFTSRRGRVLKEQLSLKCFLQGVTRRNEGNENASHLTRETTSLARQTVVIQLLFEEDAIYSSAKKKKKKKKAETDAAPLPRKRLLNRKSTKLFREPVPSRVNDKYG